MLALEQPVDAAVASAAMDPIVELLLRVARRADELALAQASPRGNDADLWAAAERDVLGAHAVPRG